MKTYKCFNYETSNTERSRRFFFDYFDLVIDRKKDKEDFLIFHNSVMTQGVIKISINSNMGFIQNLECIVCSISDYGDRITVRVIPVSPFMIHPNITKL